MSYRCSTCGELHEGLPDLGFDEPVYAQQVPAAEREARVRMDSDLCSIDDEDFFVRGVIRIPVWGEKDGFGIGAWVSQKEENFWTYARNFDSADIGPFFGWLSNDFHYDGQPCLSLKTMVHFQGRSLRPLIAVEPSDHPLSRAQQGGISLEKAWEFVHSNLGDDVE